MKHLWLLCWLFGIHNSLAQFPIVSQSDTLSTDITEHYHVLQFDTRVLHGLYVRVNAAGDTLEKGYYYNNEPVNKWLYYNTEGFLPRVRNFGKAEHQCWKTIGSYLVKTADGFQPLPLSSPPHLLNTLAATRSRLTSEGYFYPHVSYPRKARRMGFGAGVLVTVTIDEYGKLTGEVNSVKIIYKAGDSPPPSEMVKEYQEVFKKSVEFERLDAEWIPAMYKGEFVAVKFKTVIHYRLW